jgi:hypothetical protein
MGLPDILKDKTPLDDINMTFRFLITEYNFQLVKAGKTENFKAKYFAVYRNDNSKLQIEICGDISWFHCEIRRLINGQPAKYSDSDNCIGFESLAVLESNNNYEHLDYYAYGSTGLKGVLENTAKLFKRHQSFFTMDNWIDVKRIEQLRDDDFEKKYGKRPDHNKPTFFGEFKKQATKLLADNGFKLLVDSDELSPFDSSGMADYLTFHKDNKQIQISQLDWRDDYFVYYIRVDNKKVFEIDISTLDIDKAVEKTLKELTKHL